MLAEVQERQSKKKAEEAKSKKNSKKFKPKTQIKAPSPSGRDDVNDLDTLPEDKLTLASTRIGAVSFGSVNCTDIPGKIFSSARISRKDWSWWERLGWSFPGSHGEECRRRQGGQRYAIMVK